MRCINLNLWPFTRYQIKNQQINKELNFIHLNINSLLPKTNELHYIEKCSHASVIGIAETELDKTFYSSEVAVDEYSIQENDRNRKSRGEACYIRNKICFSSKKCLSDNIENIFSDLLFQKTKQISVGVIYKLPSQTQFSEQTIMEFEPLDPSGELLFSETYNPNKTYKFYKDFLLIQYNPKRFAQCMVFTN